MADKRLIDYNPDTGLLTYTAEEDGKTVIGYENPDVSPTLDFAHELRSDEDYWKRGVKKGLAHYATVPDSVLMECWIKFGLNPYTAEGTRRVFKIINEHYPNLKVTTKKHQPKV